MNLKFAKLLSYLLHPLLMPTLLIGALYVLSPEPLLLVQLSFKGFLFILGFIFIYTAVFPSLLVYYLFKKNYVYDMELSRLHDRKIPFLFSVILYATLFYFMYSQGGILIPVSILLLGMAIIISMIGLISLKWQISAHMAGIGGVLGTFIVFFIKYGAYNLFIPILLLLITSGLLGSARLRQNAHTLSQVSAGFLLGLVVSCAGIWNFI
ncbi:hypothetical protein GVN16_23485 [Emticicia sp. CRIBPO]|uniref:hypothetical protein n=1 Tax=Emticicia sp. CRIBPO TaxID=2683258 RepID=UPI001411CBDC|nr:hypothetical protein [Emticicia sp. CRIBPO]NBA88757.1 hypothetical protein [Emticicia sp. CRIBPO]